jgi:signal peptidase I
LSKKARSRLFAAFVIAAAAAALLAGYRWGTRSARQAAAGRWFRITGPSMAPTLSPGQRCLLRPLDRRPQIGDVVAVRWDGHRRIKRVAAVGGDTVSISAGRLLVNGQRLEDRLALQGQHRRDGFIPPAQVAVPD